MKLTKEQINKIAQDIFVFAMNITWGKSIEAEWHGNELIVMNDAEAYESKWDGVADDIADTARLIASIAGGEVTKQTEDGRHYMTGIKFDI